jgi:hypothetical protein
VGWVVAWGPPNARRDLVMVTGRTCSGSDGEEAGESDRSDSKEERNGEQAGRAKEEKLNVLQIILANDDDEDDSMLPNNCR